ncbi:MAG: RluA family pseudouridine synthase [Lautropia sp.]|nr:RluA family pseudouridine synthase [Lautropia sp.]
MKPLRAKAEIGSARAPTPSDGRQRLKVASGRVASGAPGSVSGAVSRVARGATSGVRPAPRPESQPEVRPEGRSEVRHLIVGEQSEGQRLDNFLLRRLKGVPKSLIHRVIRTGQVRVNGHRCSADHKIALGDDVRVPPVTLSGRQDPAGGPATAAHPVLTHQVPVLFEDDALIALDKPAGLAVHGGSGIQAGLIEQLRAVRPQAAFLELVHRLDRDTSGVLLVAKQRKALVTLHRALAEGRTHKRYFAWVKGYWGRAAATTLRFPLHRFVAADGERRVRVQVDGQAASTRIHLVRHVDSAGVAGFPPSFSLVECELLTGRTHQIRVHLAQAGFPILGDQKYGDFALNKLLYKYGHKRMFLHAFQMEAMHPGSGLRLQVKSPLPAAFEALEAYLQGTNSVLKLK